MLTDGWPDAREFPYVALIRIRYAHQLDAAVVSAVQRRVAGVLPTRSVPGFVAEVRAAGARAARHDAGARTEVDRERLAAALTAFADFDEICPTWPRPWPWPWPGPWPHGPQPDPWQDGPRPEPWRERFAALLDGGLAEAGIIVVGGAVALVEQAAGEALRAELSGVLDRTAEELTQV